MARILIADDESDFRISVSEALRGVGHEVEESSTVDEASERLQKSTFDVVVSDLRMPGRSGIELLRDAAVRMPDAILIVLTAYGSLETAIEALRLGAHDYMLKPVRLEVLLHKIGLFMEHQAALAENRFLRRAIETAVSPTGLVGKSESIAQVRHLIAKVAPTESTVLITGETGTGKEVVARSIHQASARKDRPFVAINCGSIPETLLESELFGHVRGSFTGADKDKRGLFEVAGSGTIFLDEIGEMPINLQPKVLRALENREILRVGATGPIKISARIVAATHRALLEMVDMGRFRPDLYYRLNVIEIPIPPLRKRPEDIGVLAQHLLLRHARGMNRAVPTLEHEALMALEQYRWPGNVRELSNVLERALILNDGTRIGMADLPGFLSGNLVSTEDDLKNARRLFERAHILRVIEKCSGDKRRAAAALGIDLSSLYRKLEGPDAGSTE
jgi:DNA-binding NtrC family response regulator